MVAYSVTPDVLAGSVHEEGAGGSWREEGTVLPPVAAPKSMPKAASVFSLVFNVQALESPTGALENSAAFRDLERARAACTVPSPASAVVSTEHGRRCWQ